MQLDAQTLRELELFVGPEGGPSLFELLKRTLTRGGERRLRHRFEHPLTSLSEIQAVQETLKFLLAEPEGWQPALSGRQERLIEEYFFSGIEVVSSGWRPLAFVLGLKQAFIHHHFAEIEGGCLETWHALRDMHQLWRMQRERPKPLLLEQIWQQFEPIFTDQRLEPLWRPKTGLRFTDIFIFDRLLRETCLQEARKLFNLIFELDALHALARLCRERGFVFPEFSAGPEPRLELEGLVHPRLTKPVANSLKLDQASHFLMLTGPNMGGKTTFLKACALAVYLAHLGMGVPARKMRLSLFSGLMTSLQNLDNLELGYSYFYSEVRRVKQAAELIHRQERVLVIFDELFRGTNLQDAFDASLEIIQRLSRHRQTLCILSTHLLELLPRLQELPGLQFACFRVNIRPKGFDFDYQLYSGVSEHKIGLAILKQEGVLELLDGPAPVRSEPASAADMQTPNPLPPAGFSPVETAAEPLAAEPASDLDSMGLGSLPPS